MITNKEIQACKLSATKKDFYQIWNELLDTAVKISERWDPTSTNESDPGIVLLKVLTAVADKLNYNIDKNVLECFLPSATQEESVRKLCEMLGYNMKYYQSATTEATVSYTKSSDTNKEIKIPIFSTLTNADNSIVYTTLEDINLSILADDSFNSTSSRTVPCIEGSIVQCETNTNNIITINLLDDNYRFYLPEAQIAENGIYVYNYTSNSTSVNTASKWEPVNNLNTALTGARVYKFGYDSTKRMPYLQFPEDIAEIIDNGLVIFYLRTAGANGNISSRTLTEVLSANILVNNEESSDVTLSDFVVTQIAAATNGKNLETIDDAYINYKKTIGTFDTLITCRDYMNKIYELVDSTNNYVVSNVIVSDIRDDINRAITICEFSNSGIKYVDKAIINQQNKIVYDKKDINKINPIMLSEDSALINHFDLMLYPFNTIYEQNTKEEFEKSFKYSKTNHNDIEDLLQDSKTISHKFNYPGESPNIGEEITCIKNYLKLNAKITTTYKVNAAEEASILANIKTNIYKHFNLRKIDFGEEIPFDNILKVIEEADERIKNVSLEEPILYTAVQTNKPQDEYNPDKDTITEYVCDLNTGGQYDPATSSIEFKKLLNKLILRNILAGRVELFNYNNTCYKSYSDSKYVVEHGTEEKVEYEAEYPVKKESSSDQEHITEIRTECRIPATKSEGSENWSVENLTLSTGESIIFRAPNFRTKKTYPAYVNYYIHLNETSEASNSIPADFVSLREFLNAHNIEQEQLHEKEPNWREFEILGDEKNYFSEIVLDNYDDFRDTPYFKKDTVGSTVKFIRITEKIDPEDHETIFKISFDTEPSVYLWGQLLRNKSENMISSLYSSSFSASNIPGYLVDDKLFKYLIKTKTSYSDNIDNVYVNNYIVKYDKSDPEKNKVNLNVGVDAELGVISNGTEYQLKSGEYVCINYTSSETSADGIQTSKIVNEVITPPSWIKPQFDNAMEDTQKEFNNGVNPNKTEGFDFTSFGINNPQGLKSLGINEQIEVRELAQINFSDYKTTGANVYWELNPESYTDENKLIFPFKDKTSNNTEITAAESTYTLKEGEKFYYTDQNKLDVAYYGFGSVITKKGNWDLKRQSGTEQVSSSDILLKGYSIVPWVQINEIKANEKDICIQEFQYKSIGSGALVEKITLSDTVSTEPQSINNSWRVIKDALWKASSESKTSESLPQINTNQTNEYGWKVRSLLTLDIDNKTAQELTNTYDSIQLWGYAGEYDDNNPPSIKKLYDYEIKPIKRIDEKGEEEKIAIPVSLKSNYRIKSSSEQIDTSITLYNTDLTVKEHLDNFALAVSHTQDVKVGKSTLDLSNFGESGNLTLLKLSAVEKDSAVTLNISIPEKNFGLIMMYYDNKEFDRALKTRPSISINSTSAEDTPSIYNLYQNSDSDSFTWWTDYCADNKYYLRDGINIIYLTNKVSSISILVEDDDSKLGDQTGSIIFSNLSCVYDDQDGINIRRIGYQSYEDSYTVTLLGQIDSGFEIELDDKTFNNNNTNNISTLEQLIKAIATTKYKNFTVKKQHNNSLIFTAKNKNEKVPLHSSINYGNIEIDVLQRTNSDITPAKQLLKDINLIDTDHNFYYNVPIDNSLAIDLNEADNETLATPRILYNYNNVNNKFVISEISANDLDSGIIIARSSKL